MNLTEKDIIEYFHKCFTSVDGLWFLKVEEMFNFETALATDEKVWFILPKIQARFLKERLQLKTDCGNIFFEALNTKLTLDRFEFKLIKKENIIEVKISHCPWHNILKKSGRGTLSARIGSVICPNEYKVFAAEFNPEIKLDINQGICSGKKFCILQFIMP